MHKLILPLFIAIAFSPAALAETKTCQDNFVPSMGRASGGFVVGDCTLYKTARGARAMFRQVSSVCKENEACAMTVDAAKYCEAGFCEWKIRKVLSVAAVAAGQPNASAGQPEGAEDQSKPDATQSKTGAAQPNSDCQTTLVVYGINLRGATFCNPDWLDRPASKAILEMAQSCGKRPDAKTLTRQGMDDFERDLKANGKDTACKTLDGLLKTME